MRDTMTASEAQAMVEDILAYESVGETNRIEPIEEIGTPADFLDTIEEGMAQIKAAEQKLQKHAEAMYKLTDWNDHQGANLYLAQKVLRDKKLTAIGKALQQLHNAVGSMPSSLIEFRQKVFWPMLEAAMKSKFHPREVDILMQGF